MIRFIRLVVLAVLISSLVGLAVPNAGAGGPVVFDDDFMSNPDPYAGYDPKTAGGAEQGCDTLDPWPGATVNSSLVKYKCQPVADIKSFSLKTATDGFFEATWTMGGKVPTTPEEVLALGADSLTLLMLFQNDKSQNARQIIGDAPDCSRYEHRGPYLTGDGYRLLFFYTMRVILNTQNLENWNPTDPASALLSSTVTAGVFFPGNLGWTAPSAAQGPYTGTANRCVGTTLTTIANANDPGTRATSELVSSGNLGSVNDTVKIRFPMKFHYYSAAAGYLQRDWVLASSGHTIENVVAQSLGTVPMIWTPPLRYGTTVSTPSQSSSFPVFFDWAPWHGFDMGTFFVPPNFGPTISVAGVPAQAGTAPTCPHYANSAKNLNTEGIWQDNEVQTNTLFGPPGAFDGLSHYDSSEEDLPRRNQFGVQDHFGPVRCEIPLQGGFGYRSTPLKFDA